MENVLLILFVLAIFLLALILWLNSFRKKPIPVPLAEMPEADRAVLRQYVEFYDQLDPTRKQEFEERVLRFLTQVRITGVKTNVEQSDQLMIAASAIIPIFGFPGWEYVNLKEVLLYPDSFNEHWAHDGGDRFLLGMVGSGPMENVMILSKHELRQGFLNKSGKSNTAIHEFVHLLDKSDGSVDGIPELLLSRQYVLPWLQMMQKEIEKIRSNRSDINPYGATDMGEFFAVAAEYFFERPGLLASKHPELYRLLTMIFRQTPA